MSAIASVLERSSKGNVYINAAGQFLVRSERTTHTGHHIDITFTENINEATVMPSLDVKTMRQHPGLDRKVHAIPAILEVKRTVRLAFAEAPQSLGRTIMFGGDMPCESPEQG